MDAKVRPVVPYSLYEYWDALKSSWVRFFATGMREAREVAEHAVNFRR